jgi:hypothetical protein
VPDPRRGNLAGERADLGGREARIAVSLQHEVPSPRRADLRAVAEHVRLDAERRSERGERCVGRGELLVRRRPESEARVLREERLAGAEVEDDGARLGRAHVARVQRPGELVLQCVTRSRLGGWHEEESDDCRYHGGNS